MRGQVLRLATEVDLALLGAHPHVRFCAATTGPANLLVALAAANPDALYTFLTDSVGPLGGVTAIDTPPLLASVKRTGVIRS